jgi:release factor glutamine methyltransferase
MTIAELLGASAQRLQPKIITCAADKTIGRLEAEILLAFVLKKDRMWLIAHSDEQVKDLPLRRFNVLIKQRVQHEPIAYILGEKDFYGRPFFVNRHTLIPRPETELMVETVVGTRHAVSLPIIWDVGTGSGALAVTLACEVQDATVLASDVSAQALVVARKNAKRHGAEKRITFVKANLLDKKIEKIISDMGRGNPAPTLIITANLPYLPMSDQKILEPDVVKFEPSSALFCERDGTELIIKLLDQIALAKHAWRFSSITILLEFDPPQAKELKKIAKSTFPYAIVTIHKDLAKRNRLLEIRIA